MAAQILAKSMSDTMDNIMQTVQAEMDRAVERQQRARASLQANLASVTTNLVSVRNSMPLGTNLVEAIGHIWALVCRDCFVFHKFRPVCPSA